MVQNHIRRDDSVRPRNRAAIVGGTAFAHLFGVDDTEIQSSVVFEPSTTGRCPSRKVMRSRASCVELPVVEQADNASLSAPPGKLSGSDARRRSRIARRASLEAGAPSGRLDK